MSDSLLRKAVARIDSQGHDLPPSPVWSSSACTPRRYAIATELVYTEHNDQYRSSSVPIYQ
ncbi:cystathionine beta-lyase, partial [Ascosphaera acerosa]